MQLPETLEFSKDFIERAAKEEKLQSGIFQCIIKSAEKNVGKKDFQWFNFRLNLFPLREVNNPKSVAKQFRLSTWVVLPQINMNSEIIQKHGESVMELAGEKSEQIGRMSADTLRAIFGKKAIPDWPTRQDGNYLFDGKVIDSTQVEAARNIVLEKTGKVVAQAWQDPNVFVDFAPYCSVDTDGQYPNIKKMWEELPAGMSLTERLTAK